VKKVKGVTSAVRRKTTRSDRKRLPGPPALTGPRTGQQTANSFLNEAAQAVRRFQLIVTLVPEPAGET